jgi:hypothetical protein
VEEVRKAAMVDPKAVVQMAKEVIWAVMGMWVEATVIQNPQILKIGMLDFQTEYSPPSRYLSILVH